MSYSSSNIYDFLRRDLVKFRHLLEVEYQRVEFVILFRVTAVSRSLRSFRSLRCQILFVSDRMVECVPCLSLLKHRLHRRLTARQRYRLWESDCRQVEVHETVS